MSYRSPGIALVPAMLAALLAVSAANADPIASTRAPLPSLETQQALATSLPGLEADALTLTTALGFAGTSAVTPEVAAVMYWPARKRSEAVTYRPRPASTPPRSSYHSEPTPSPVQIYAGYIEPEGVTKSAFTMGLRGGPQITPNLQLGASVDWQHKSESDRAIVGDPYTQGGSVVTPERVLSRATTDVIPVMGFMQINLGTGPFVPYIGAGGGYEWLLLSAQDYTTGFDYEATFGGWGWQAWAGLGLSVGKGVKLTGEIFTNQAEVEREVFDITGIAYRERVNLDGAGLRFGLNFGF